ncbi:DNA ligase [Rhodoferax saidenbachensis]|uniref:DNA ligase-1 n=1 Tax=Rhodoferax saidenbachensis TaxID=1484693 RepID=A0ABU1ZN82_9BURK|nr:DNA ligase [Rhodoferax saidenbachensis]MDR7306988.1 DNA ligase-1 [Rhodoferax saidenbachensis]
MPQPVNPTRRHFVCTLGALALPWAAPASSATAPPLMLAKSYDGRSDPTGFWVSEKYDGVRGYWDGQRLLTRAGNPIAAPAWFIAGWPASAMEGELWAGRGQFSQAVSTVRQQTPDDAAWRALRFMVFDLPAEAGTFNERLPVLRARVAQLGQAWVQAVEQTPAATVQSLQTRLAETVRAGGEGLVLHRGSALYTAQRSDDLRKFKPFDDAEARVVGHVAGTGKHAGRLGALWLEQPARDAQPAQRFKLGTGFSDAQRQDPPPVGSWVTYRYRGVTDKGVPRFASFLRVAVDSALLI